MVFEIFLGLIIFCIFFGNPLAVLNNLVEVHHIKARARLLEAENKQKELEQ